MTAINTAIQNNFTAGLKTEFTGLNFPENACTSVNNCVFQLIGDVVRREGFNFENGFTTNSISLNQQAVSSYFWRNVGGSGSVQILVVQVGNTLYFYQTSNASAATPVKGVSGTLLGSTVNLGNFSTGNPGSVECQFSDGNGFLFVFHPNCDPFYCSYNTFTGAITGTTITVQIRDTLGVVPGEPTTPSSRPSTLNINHQYNLINQGWNIGSPWSVTSTTSNQATILQEAFTVQTGQIINNGDYCYLYSATHGSSQPVMSGSVNNYNSASGVLTLYIDTVYNSQGVVINDWTIKSNSGSISTFQQQIGLYPSNADIWWLFKNSQGLFQPSSTFTSVNQNAGYAPRGHIILNLFNQDRAAQAGLSGIVPGIAIINTPARFTTGAWYQGRVWYSGINSPVDPFLGYVWSETIYFSQIITNSSQFGSCYQSNDPSSSVEFAILPTDGGSIQIQGSGTIIKLFPVHNGLLVFATNGIWLITGNSQLGFTATDYSISKVSAVKCLSGTSFVDVLGYPMFWNAEGIYHVHPGKDQIPYGHGGFQVDNLCIGTIQTFFNNIPLVSKQYARGDYDPINFRVAWIYKTISEVDENSRYKFDGVLNLNTILKSFYPYTVQGTTPNIADIKYITYPGASISSPQPSFLFFTTWNGGTSSTFSGENDNTTWLDFHSFDNIGVNYTSTFITGYQMHGKHLLKWQPMYVYMFSRTNNIPAQYLINSIWDFAQTQDSGRISSAQLITLGLGMPNYSMVFRRHKLRGDGLSCQFQVSSVQGKPFDLIGWSIFEQIKQEP